MGELVDVEVRDRIGWITFTNPSRRNSLSAPLIDELLAAFAELERASVPVVVVRAPSGSEVWSAGHDIRELPKHGRDPLGYDDPLEKVLRAVQCYPGAVIAMIEGTVWGGACDFALTCDLVIGAPNCSFAITPAKIGLPYNISGVQHFLSRLGPNRAKEMFFTARPLNADRARSWGILNHLVELDRLEPFTADLAAEIATNSSLAIAAIKEQFHILDDARPLSPATFERLAGLRRKVYDSHDYTEGIDAFLEKRSPVFRGE